MGKLHFCFELTAQHSSQKGYTGTDREFSVYESDKRTIPDNNTFTATKEKYDTFMEREQFTHSLLKKFHKKYGLLFYFYLNSP